VNPAAGNLVVPHQLAGWDALVLNVSAEGGARLLLTEDLHHA
jgi:predicted nucleic acid-binding protein